MFSVKIIAIVLLVLFINTVSSTQVKSFDDFTRLPSIEVNIGQDSTIEVYNKATNERYLKNISSFPISDNHIEADLILELDTVIFNHYENLYHSWGKINAWNAYAGNYIAIDANSNQKVELYVYQLINNPPFGPYTGTQIYEQDNDSLFSLIFDFPLDSLSMFFDVGDITNDGLLDIFCKNYSNGMQFFNQSGLNDLIIEENFIYNPFPPQYQPNTPTFYDIDNDANLELLYFLFAGDGDSVWAYSNHVAKFNPQINNFELIYYHRPLPDFYTYGISTGDFDEDDKGNFATGSIYGKFYIYEYVEGTQYKVELEDTLETFNAYLTTFSDDMDGNGKRELWIGGDFNSSTYGGVTRIYAFESENDGVYNQVFQIDIRGLFAFTVGKMRYINLDYDNEKEIFLANGDFVFGIKSNGNGSYYFDFIKLLPLIDTAFTSQYIARIDAADLDSDGVSEIISQHNLFFNNNTGGYYSVFYKRDKISGVNENGNTLPNVYSLYQNYPNPFNPYTTLRYSLPVESNLLVRVFNTLGEEIKELINDTRSSGEYEITWDGTNNSGIKVPSGIYLITMKANSTTKNASGFQKTIKSVLLK